LFVVVLVKGDATAGSDGLNVDDEGGVVMNPGFRDPLLWLENENRLGVDVLGSACIVAGVAVEVP
jgi:hypothetical protein